MTRKTNLLPETASQTAGPYVHIGLTPCMAGFEIYERDLGSELPGPNVDGDRIQISGRVIDGAGDIVKDALIEVWQPDANGAFEHSENAGFRGWARVVTDFETGIWSVETIKPGAVSDANGATHAPHLTLWIVARGINVGLHTRLYFSDEAESNAKDPVLLRIADEMRRETLIAKQHEGVTYQFDIVLQGENETVFFDA